MRNSEVRRWGALTGEFVCSDKGLGYMLIQASGNVNTALLFATLSVLSVLAMAFFYLIRYWSVLRFHGILRNELIRIDATRS
jgi:NitT/TauT family transport system permease protein